MNETTYQSADRAILAYDSYVFSSVGRSFAADKADLLAANAAIACEVAARDRRVNQFTRNFYRARAAEFIGIAS